MARRAERVTDLKRYKATVTFCARCSPFNLVGSVVDRAPARNTRPQPSDMGAIFCRSSSAVLASAVFVVQKFWRNLCARRNRRLAKHPGVRDQKEAASQPS